MHSQVLAKLHLKYVLRISLKSYYVIAWLKEVGHTFAAMVCILPILTVYDIILDCYF